MKNIYKDTDKAIKLMIHEGFIYVTDTQTVTYRTGGTIYFDALGYGEFINHILYKSYYKECVSPPEESSRTYAEVMAFIEALRKGRGW